MNAIQNVSNPSKTVKKSKRKCNLETAMNNLKQLLQPTFKKGTRVKKKPSFHPKKVQTRSSERFTNYKEGEFHPDKPKRKRRTEKIVLKRKTELKVVVATNKRKRCTPHKGVTASPASHPAEATEPFHLTTWFQLTSPPHRSLTELTIEDMIRMDEDSLSDDDLMEILTCPSPVWWEEPPQEFKEGVLTVIEETQHSKADTTDLTDRVITNKNVGVDINMKRSKTAGDTNTEAKIAKLENVLGNIKRRVINSDRLHIETPETLENYDSVNKLGNKRSDVETDDRNENENKVRGPTHKTFGQGVNLKETAGSHASEQVTSKPRTISSDGSEISWNGDDLLRNLENIDIPIKNDNTDQDDVRNNNEDEVQIVDELDTHCGEITHTVDGQSNKSNKNDIKLTKPSKYCNKQTNKVFLEIQPKNHDVLDVRLKKTPTSAAKEITVGSLDNPNEQNCNLAAARKAISIEREFTTSKSSPNEKKLMTESNNETILITDDSDDSLETPKPMNIMEDNEDIIHLDCKGDNEKRNLESIGSETNDNEDACQTITSTPILKSQTGTNDNDSVLPSESDKFLNTNDIKTSADINNDVIINNDVSLTKNLEKVPSKSENSIVINNDICVKLPKNDINKVATLTRLSAQPTSESPISIRSVTSESAIQYSEGTTSDTNVRFIDEYLYYIEDKNNKDQYLNEVNKNIKENIVDKNEADVLNNTRKQDDLDEDDNSQSLIPSLATSLNNSIEDDDISMEEEYLDVDSDRNEEQYPAEEIEQADQFRSRRSNLGEVQDSDRTSLEDGLEDAGRKVVRSEIEEKKSLEDDFNQENRVYGIDADTLSLQDNLDQENEIFCLDTDDIYSEVLDEECKMVETDADTRKSFEDALEQENRVCGVDADMQSLQDNLDQENEVLCLDTDDIYSEVLGEECKIVETDADRRKSLEDALDRESKTSGIAFNQRNKILDIDKTSAEDNLDKDIKITEAEKNVISDDAVDSLEEYLSDESETELVQGEAFNIGKTPRSDTSGSDHANRDKETSNETKILDEGKIDKKLLDVDHINRQEETKSNNIVDNKINNLQKDDNEELVTVYQILGHNE